MVLADRIDQYLESLKDSSPHTIKNYTHYLNEFVEFAKGRQTDKELIHKYKMHLSKKGYKKTTQNYFLIALRSFLRFSKEYGLSSEDINLFKHERTVSKPLSIEDVDKLVNLPKKNTPEGLRDALVLSLLSSSDFKISLLASLNRSDVAVLRMNPNIAQLMDRYLMSRHDVFKPLFIRFKGKVDSSNNGEKMRLSIRSIERLVRKYSREAQIEATPEVLRQTKLT